MIPRLELYLKPGEIFRFNRNKLIGEKVVFARRLFDRIHSWPQFLFVENQNFKAKKGLEFLLLQALHFLRFLF